MAASTASYHRRQSRRDAKEVINRPKVELNEYILSEKLKDRLQQLHSNAPENHKRIFKEYIDEFEDRQRTGSRKSSAAPFSKAITSHRLDFKYQFQPPANIQKPKHSQMLPSSNAEVDKTLGKTVYEVEHEQVAKFTPRKLEPLKTSSTKNNPHPLKPFMDWQLKPNVEDGQQSPLIEQSLYEMVQRDKNQSTYRKDFTPSMPDMQRLASARKMISSRQPKYDEDTWKSITNATFKYNKLDQSLLNPVTRFGSNPHIKNYAVGI
ncbi:hypothetical protein TrispH2_011403 [Trichoplax sp. H2]|nr:hypothetical protein TrispH2_011403 [Trichoplax sp. H2]|eukprot:RDD37037.1 hypothetical protein TrispH2_011403 [Trichoplax sp. H2]